MSQPKVGIILAQLGTPEAPTPRALRPYLREFLGDPRVIEANRLVWWFILNLLILPRRPARSARLYQRIWTQRGSPLLYITRDQTEALEKAMGGAALVDFAMRYGNPTLASTVARLQARGAERLLIFPMFPQYASATTGSVHDAVFDYFKRVRVIPPLRFVPPYGVHAAYIQALATTAREGIAALGWKPEKILVSFHGIPRRYIDAGDVYRDQCEATARALVAALGLHASEWQLCFQSRFGREEWLTPYTEETVAELGKQGLKRIAALCPGFTTDCLETIDEVGREAKHTFVAAGGEDLRLIPCLNSHPAWIEAMAAIAREELRGWL